MALLQPANASPRDPLRRRLARARLYLICDSAPAAGPLDVVLRAALSGGVQIVQLRDKRLDDRELLRTARRARALCAQAGALFIVNDRPEVALAARADGVHVGQDDLPLEEVRALIGDKLLVGVSTHSPQDIQAAQGADYIGVGPVFATPTKPGRAPVGEGLVAHAALHCRLPFFAIGGIDRGNVGKVVTAGATRVAVVRAIAAAGDPHAAARQLRHALDIAQHEHPSFDRPSQATA
ncbi:MAG: thiamine phosphate synthase [Solirubrobacteraceae bacterium]